MVPPESKTAQGFELQIGVNHLGHFALAMQLIDVLSSTPEARVVTVSSLAHRQGKISFDDLHWQKRGYSASSAYGQSKLANLLFTQELQRRFDEAGVKVRAVAAHPGWTVTNLQQHSFLFRMLNPIFGMRPPQGALPTLFAATSPDVKDGGYYGPDGFFELRGYPKEAAKSSAATNAEDAARLWEVSEQLTGAQFAVGEASTSVAS